MKLSMTSAGFRFTRFLTRGLAVVAVTMLALAIAGCGGAADDASTGSEAESTADSLRFEGETHLANIRQLTFGGNNAEAYWSFDDERLVFQSDWSAINDQGCDQIFVMDPETVDGDPEDYTLVSTGTGRTTCSYFLPDGRIVYASTHEGARECPETVMFEQGRYVWPIHDTYDIYVTDGEGYDAEATVSPDGRFVIFTSTRSGDLELWRYELETGEALQLTSELGYDGGAFFSRDSQKIVWRASRPEGEDADVYRSLLEEGLVEPSALDIYVADIDGSNVQRVTELPGANWAPFFHPDGDRVLFTSNHHTLDEGGREFDIFMVDLNGENMERITFSGTFDAFPMFSFDGSKLAFASNRTADGNPTDDTNIFVADWVE